MSLMNIQKEKNKDFLVVYNKSYRLAAAVFAVAGMMDDGEELKNKIKNISLEIVSLSVKLKDTTFFEAKKIISEIEKDTLLLMSILDISAIAGMISKMNAQIIKEEFESFIKELSIFTFDLNASKNIAVEELFKKTEDQKDLLLASQNKSRITEKEDYGAYVPQVKVNRDIVKQNGNGQNRKLARKTNIYDFIKRHNNVTIKDIIPHIVGCSEKTIQRELVNLINNGKISKSGERRWTRYSAI